MRWLHESFDHLQVAVASLLRPQVFAHGMESPTLQDHVASVRLTLPPLTEARRYELTADSLVGPLDVEYRVRPAPRPEAPVLVYHHGVAEMPYTKTFRLILPLRLPVDAHVVVVRAPFHRSWLTLRTGLRRLTDMVAMCAVSIQLIESILQLLRHRGAQGSLVTGISLGGFIALMHHLLLGSADRCVPLLAGPDLAHTLIHTPFRRFLSAPALEQTALIKARLDFRQAFQASDVKGVFPLLAEYDLDIPYAHHHACYTACGIPVVTLPNRGHISGSMSFSALRAHLLGCLAPLSQHDPARPELDEIKGVNTDGD